MNTNTRYYIVNKATGYVLHTGEWIAQPAELFKSPQEAYRAVEAMRGDSYPEGYALNETTI